MTSSSANSNSTDNNSSVLSQSPSAVLHYRNELVVCGFIARIQSALKKKSNHNKNKSAFPVVTRIIPAPIIAKCVDFYSAFDDEFDASAILPLENIKDVSIEFNAINSTIICKTRAPAEKKSKRLLFFGSKEITPGMRYHWQLRIDSPMNETRGVMNIGVCVASKCPMNMI